MIYLDHAATTPVPAAVADAMYDVLRHQFGNPSAQYPYGRESAALVDRCRAAVAQGLGCRPEQLFFASCGTESDNWAISAAVWQGRHVGRHIITTALEHSIGSSLNSAPDSESRCAIWKSAARAICLGRSRAALWLRSATICM